MEELIGLLKEFHEVLRKQTELLSKFQLVLEEEEKAISKYHLQEIEQTVIVKDQFSRIFQTLEQNRAACLKKIFYLMAFDARDQKLSLSLFRHVFSIYLKNMRNLISQEHYNIIEVLHENFLNQAENFEKIFKEVSPHIYRNQLILKKMLRHIQLSLNLFQSEADLNLNYNSSGMTKSILNQNQSVSLVRVKV